MPPVPIGAHTTPAGPAGAESTTGAPQAAATEMLTTMTTTSMLLPLPPTPPFPPLLDSPQVYLPMYPRHFSSGTASAAGGHLPPHYYTQPCKCDLGRQIRYYNHKDREFYYHTAVRVTSPAAPVPVPTLAGEDVRDGEIVLDFGGGGDDSPSTSLPLPLPLPPSSSSPFGLYYDPYGPVVPPQLAPVPPDYHPARQPGGYHHYLYQDNGLCEGIIVVLALMLWLYSFYRLYLVWQNTLNFNESSIQGPQGWDLLVSWVVERIRLRKLALRVLGVPGMTIKRRSQTARRGAGVEVSVVEATEAPDEEEDEEDEDDIASEGGGRKVRTSSRRATLEFELIQRGGGRGGGGGGKGGGGRETVDGPEESEEASRTKHLPLDLATSRNSLRQCQAAPCQPPLHSCDRIAVVINTDASGQNLAPPPPPPLPPLQFSIVQPSLDTVTTEMGEAEEKQEKEEVAPGDKNGGVATVVIV